MLGGKKMEQTEIKNKVQSILDENMIGTMATVEGNKPFSRYMAFFNDDFILYTATSVDTHKVEDIEQNNNVHILIGYNGEGTDDLYVEIEAQAEIDQSSDIRDKVWNDKLEPWFDGKDDPKMTILKLVPEKIRLMNTKENDPQTLNL